jgi:hypothetical protein
VVSKSQASGLPHDVFSDRNQWLLKVLVGRRLPDGVINVPRAPARSAVGVASLAGVSAPAAWRLFQALKAGGHLDDEGGLVRVRDLLSRWRAASQRPQRHFGAAWIMPGRDPLQKLRAALAKADLGMPHPTLPGALCRLHALGVGFVRAGPPLRAARRGR